MVHAEGSALEASCGTPTVVVRVADARSRLLLKKSFDALAPGGTIAIAEILVDAERKAALPAPIFAVNMLVNSEAGDTFSLDEMRAYCMMRVSGRSAQSKRPDSRRS